MQQSRIVVGLEIGTSKVCAVVGEIKGDGLLRILGAGRAVSCGVRKGELVDWTTASVCVKEALAEAEEKADVEITNVYLAVTGGHIQGFNNRGCVNIPEDRTEIDEKDCDDVLINGRDVSIPQQDVILHSILQGYRVDGQGGVQNPLGVFARKFEADFHIIHAAGNRVKNAIRCVKELGIEVDDVVFSGFAASQIVLTRQQKEMGALLIDIGGGVTEYVFYLDGDVKQSGVLAVGGDHLTNDVSIGFRIPTMQAERLKIQEGSATYDGSIAEKVTLTDVTGFTMRQIERESLNTILHLRVREIFELLAQRLERQTSLAEAGAGVFLTGGTSLLKGIQEVAHDVFQLPVHVAPWSDHSGSSSVAGDPTFSVAAGLIKYADAMQPDSRPPGFFGGIGQWLRRTIWG